MNITAAIFDMDGLLIDSEPLWHEATLEAMADHGVTMTTEEYATSIGLRTREFLQFWLPRLNLDLDFLPDMEASIMERVMAKIREKGVMMPGVLDVLSMLRDRGLRIGLASSSPFRVIDTVLAHTGLGGAFEHLSSAEHLPLGKPHPQVYLDCATALGVPPLNCLCFEDSFPGLIAAKAARMHCVVVPAPEAYRQKRWQAADLVLPSLLDLGPLQLDQLLR